MARGLMTPVKAPEICPPQFMKPVVGSSNEKTAPSSELTKPKTIDIKIDTGKCCKRDDRYPTSFFRQMGILLLRTFLILWRDRSLATMRLGIHLVMAPLIGTLYFGIGNEASHVLNNYKFAFFSIMFLSYTAFSSIILNCKFNLIKHRI